MSKRRNKQREQRAAELARRGLKGRRRDKPGQLALPGMVGHVESEQQNENNVYKGDKR